MNDIIFGVAYYEEYLPCDRLEEDMERIAAAGLNTVRIAESTWCTLEPEPGRYDFSHVDRVIAAAARRGLDVIVGTPTYAIPPWLARLDPEVLAWTKDGRRRFGPRQNMDITNPTYLRYAERVIRALVSHTAACPNVIGYQIDNETKHYGTAGPRVVARFRQWLKERFGTVEKVNAAFGLNHWSNAAASFEELPDPSGTVNGSYACAFARFQRELAAEFLLWQSALVSEYKRPEQFITQNFDYEWRSFGPPGQQDGYSWGVQPDICHYDAARAVTLVGTDIYCFTQDRLTGMEIAFGGDLMRPLKHAPYLVLESQAQAFRDWLPYPGQLRQMAFSHLASGARGLLYWGWSSIHNGLESYWKGLLSHDFEPNPTSREAAALGAELKRLAPRLAGMEKKNRAALVVSTEALSALNWFPTDKDLSYNDIVLWLYRAMYELNLECDVIFDRETDWSPYRLLLFPALYSVSEELAGRVRSFVADGGTVFATFRSFFADENLKIFHDPQPHGLTDCFGMTYNQYTRPAGVTVDGAPAQYWMELLKPDEAEILASYRHPYWGQYAALTRNRYGRGQAWYLGTMLPCEALKPYLRRAARDAGLEPPPCEFPLILRTGVDREGRTLRYLFHYASRPAALPSPWRAENLLTGASYAPGEPIPLDDWGVAIFADT